MVKNFILAAIVISAYGGFFHVLGQADAKTEAEQRYEYLLKAKRSADLKLELIAALAKMQTLAAESEKLQVELQAIEEKFRKKCAKGEVLVPDTLACAASKGK